VPLGFHIGVSSLRNGNDDQWTYLGPGVPGNSRWTPYANGADDACPGCGQAYGSRHGLYCRWRRIGFLAAMAATGPQPFTWMEPFPLDGNTFSERPGPVKGAPLLGTAKRPLDGEDRSGAIKKEEMLLPRVPKVAPQK
jgi:hypothetical protein